MTRMVLVTDLRGGEVFVGFGPGWTVQGRARWTGEAGYGGSQQRQRYAVTLVNGEQIRVLPCCGETRITTAEEAGR